MKNLNRIKRVLSARQGAEIPKYQTPGGPLPVPLKDIKSVENKNGKYYVNGIEVNKEQYDVASAQLNTNFQNTANQKGQELLGSDFSDLNALSNQVKSRLNSISENTPVVSNNSTISVTDPDFQKWCANSGIRPSPDNLTIYQQIKTKYPNQDLNRYVDLYQVLKNTDSLDKISSLGEGATNTELYGNNPMAIPGAKETGPYAAVEHAADLNQSIENKIAERKANAVTSSPLQAPPIQEITVPKPTSLNTDISQLQQKVQTKMKQEAESYGMNLQKQAAKKEKRTNIGMQVGQAVTGAVDMAGQALNAKQMTENSTTTNLANGLYDGAAEIANQFGPVGKIVGTAMKFADTAGMAIRELGKATGERVDTDQMTETDKWMDSSFFSWNIGLINGGFGKNTQNFAIDKSTAETVGSSYGGTMSDFNEAENTAGKRYGLFSQKARRRADENIAKAKGMQSDLNKISDDALNQRMYAQSMGEQAGLAYSMMADGGYNQKYTYAAKEGGTLEWNPVIELEWEPQIELNWKLSKFKEGGNIELTEELEWTPEFKKGGKTEELNIPQIEETTQKNVIPEGALHKNKHHMEHAEGLTKKGIPVIDDQGEQQAEIEHSEIIFTLEVTKKLEEYYEIFYSEESTNKEKEQAALEAGQLLVYQILENTEDRTGLIDSCKKGGTLNLKKSTEDLIEEALEWMPTITIIEGVIEEEKSKKKSEKSELEKDDLKEQVKDVIREALIELLIK